MSYKTCEICMLQLEGYKQILCLDNYNLSNTHKKSLQYIEDAADCNTNIDISRRC